MSPSDNSNLPHWKVGDTLSNGQKIGQIMEVFPHPDYPENPWITLQHPNGKTDQTLQNFFIEGYRQIQTKTIAIEDLPPGLAKDELTRLVLSPTTPVIVVAKEGTIGDWACYHGWPTREASKPEFVADKRNAWYFDRVTTLGGVLAFGEKFSETEARFLFPEESWDSRTYRK